ncbi:hypothetical protein F5X96DRAFT_688467 [Biscogniauxia mediterranea]|nr:hypothetical protein F5X96DRAFT_688467 [Biscogniauxia mediterranea]
MFAKVLLLAFLAAVGSATPYPARESVCTRPDGHYDVCDTVYSYVKCRGQHAAMAVDCRRSPGHYCQIINDEANLRRGFHALDVGRRHTTTLLMGGGAWRK